MKAPRLLGIGGAHVDRRGTMSAPYIYGASIPGAMIEEVGGGTFNALRVAVQFGINGTLLSVRGGDAAGDMVASEAKRRRIEDLSSTFLDRSTASYTALLESNGDVIAALADMSIYETALPRQISRRKTREAIDAADGILLDANMPSEAITKLVKACAGKPLYALAISPAKATRLRGVLSEFTCAFLNHREARAILDIAEPNASERSDALWLANGLANFGLRSFMLTNGGDQACVVSNGRPEMITPPSANAIVDVTGAGDAMAGAAIAAMLKGSALIEAAHYGLTAAAVTVETQNAVADFTDKTHFASLFAQLKPHSPVS